MPVTEKDGKWFVVKKDGSLGKRGYRTREIAEKMQAKGAALLRDYGRVGVGSPEPTPPTAESEWEEHSRAHGTADERKALGVPQLRED